MTFYRYENCELNPVNGQVVSEFPVRLFVNGLELATLVASRHQLNYLVAGFCRMQGFVQTLDDIQSLGTCEEFGTAHVRLRGEIPGRLQPVLTSGCGSGIVFGPLRLLKTHQDQNTSFTPEAVIELMQTLACKAAKYQSHGGIHSAAVGDGKHLLLHAEDLGRHNTLDRIAGEALFKQMELNGKILVTSGRVSTEMVLKAARLGIFLIASRTSPTSLAVELSEQAGITLIGYLRSKTFEVYTHPERLHLKCQGVAGELSAASNSDEVASRALPSSGEATLLGCAADQNLDQKSAPTFRHRPPGKAGAG